MGFVTLKAPEGMQYVVAADNIAGYHTHDGDLYVNFKFEVDNQTFMRLKMTESELTASLRKSGSTVI